jgi:hypothetical protein
MRIQDQEDLVTLFAGMELADLEAVGMMVQLAIRLRRQSTLTSDRPEFLRRDEEGPALHDEARAILENVAGYGDLTLADQALLAALILQDAYQQDRFSSRAINDVIEECGRPRVAHITSAIAGLTAHSYLRAEEKSLSLTKEGRTKARNLIGMLKRQSSAA